MSSRALTTTVGVIGSVVFIDLMIHAYLFYLARSDYEVTIPLALGIQVSLVSLLFVVVSLFLAFFGFSKLGDIEEKAKSEAREAAHAEVEELARKASGKVPATPRVAPRHGDDSTLEGEEEREI